MDVIDENWKSQETVITKTFGLQKKLKLMVPGKEKKMDWMDKSGF